MENKKDNWENFSKTATVLGFIADCIAVFLLLIKSLPDSPIISVNIWIIFQYTILLLGIIRYLGYLRQVWKKNYKNENISFAKYLANLLSFDDWGKLVPPIFFLFFLIVISMQVNGFVNFVVWAAVVIGLVSINATIDIENKNARNEYDIQRAKATLNDWSPRIDKFLEQKGYLTSMEMAKNYNENEHYCAWVLDYYYQVFVDSKDLIFVTDSKIRNERRITFYVVAYRMLADSQPWLYS